MNLEQLVEVNNNARVENLRTFGFKQSGANGGNPQALKPFLEQIHSGNIIDEKALLIRTPEQREAIKKEIKLLEETNIKIAIENETLIGSTLKKLKEKKDEYETKLEKYIEGGISEKNMGATIEIFNKPKFFITSFFLIMLSVFIFFFYVAVVYKALFINPQDILNDIQSGNWGISLLPHWFEVEEALSTNLMVVFAPFIFFGFGYTLHILLEIKHWVKYLYLFIVIVVTFALDFLLADQIHVRVNQALAIIDSPPGDFKDIIIVLIMGFVVYIIWSIIFHSWMNELNKLNIPNRLRKLIDSTRFDIEKVENQISNNQKQIELNNLKIAEKNSLIEGVLIPISLIINSLSEFAQGWIQFVIGTDNNNALNSCEVIYNDFMSSKGLENFKYEKDKL